jgi:hypothetical protein
MFTPSKMSRPTPTIRPSPINSRRLIFFTPEGYAAGV